MILSPKGPQFTFKHDSCIYLQSESVSAITTFHVVLLHDSVFLTRTKLVQQSEASLHRGEELSTLFFSPKEALIQSHCWFSSKNMPSLLTPLHLYPTLNTSTVNQLQLKPSSYKTCLKVQTTHWPLSLVLLNLHPVLSSCQSQSSLKARNNRVLCYNQGALHLLSSSPAIPNPMKSPVLWPRVTAGEMGRKRSIGGALSLTILQG